MPRLLIHKALRALCCAVAGALPRVVKRVAAVGEFRRPRKVVAAVKASEDLHSGNVSNQIGNQIGKCIGKLLSKKALYIHLVLLTEDLDGDGGPCWDLCWLGRDEDL